MRRTVLGRDFLGSRVRSRLTAGSPEHDQLLTGKLLDAEHGKVGRLDQVAILQKLPLNLVEMILRDTDRRKDRLAACIAILPDDDVAAAEVLEVVGECAQRADEGIRIPPCLVFNPIPFDRALPEQILQIDRELAVRALGIGRRHIGHRLRQPPPNGEYVLP